MNRGKDQEKYQAFLRKNVADIAGMFTTLLCTWGDRLGLFKYLEEHGPASSAELAAGTGLNERYLREWLGGMACAGYLEFDPTSTRFTLPMEHSPVLAREGDLPFRGGLYHMLPSFLKRMDEIEQAFRDGAGVPQDVLADDNFWKGYERYRAPRYENQLLQEWLPACPEVNSKLGKGVRCADIGCGTGQWIIKLSQAFPNSSFMGYDRFGPAIQIARDNAVAAGLADRVRFEELDPTGGLPEEFDVIFTFDVIHDAAQPLDLLRSIWKALKPGGAFICQDITCSDKLEENLGAMGALKYALSLFYCMTTSLSQGGEGLGTVGLPEPKLRDYCREAGFSSVRRAWEDPMYVLYEIKP